MENHKDWKEDVFNSMTNSHRAKPSPHLFKKIEAEINASNSKTKVRSVSPWRNYAAAACLLLMINAFAIRNISQSQKQGHYEYASVDSYSKSIISSYQIYE